MFCSLAILPLLVSAPPVPLRSPEPIVRPAADQLEHAQIAQLWIQAHGISPEEIDPDREIMHAVLERTFIEIEIGGLRIFLPPLSSDSSDAAISRVVTACSTVLDVHEVWAEWNTTGTSKHKLPKDVAKARKIINKWWKKHFEKALLATEPGTELFASTKLDKKAQPAFETWNTWIRKSSGERVASGERERLVMMPTRKEFVEFTCFLGTSCPDLRGTYWAPSVATWSEVDFHDTRVTPLAYASPDPSLGYEAEYSMNTKITTGLAQHVALMATRTLIDASAGNGLDPILAGGLANLLVIDLYEAVDTKVDGDQRSNTTNGQSRFIPASQGGKSSGGSLPPVSAESRWRSEKGKGYFVKLLQRSRKAASKKAAEKEDAFRVFQLMSDQKKTRILAAPLFHASAAQKRIDTSFFGDYAEFLRAYRVAFLYWLRDKSGKTSNEQFSEFLGFMNGSQADIANPDDGGEGENAEGEEQEAQDDTFSLASEAVYGVPLSAKNANESTLEGRFLRWLAK